MHRGLDEHRGDTGLLEHFEGRQFHRVAHDAALAILDVDADLAGLVGVHVFPLDNVGRTVEVVANGDAVDEEMDRHDAPFGGGLHLSDDADDARHTGAAERRRDAHAR